MCSEPTGVQNERHDSPRTRSNSGSHRTPARCDQCRLPPKIAQSQSVGGNMASLGNAPALPRRAGRSPAVGVVGGARAASVAGRRRPRCRVADVPLLGCRHGRPYGFLVGDALRAQSLDGGAPLLVQTTKQTRRLRETHRPTKTRERRLLILRLEKLVPTRSGTWRGIQNVARNANKAAFV